MIVVEMRTSSRNSIMRDFRVKRVYNFRTLFDCLPEDKEPRPLIYNKVRLGIHTYHILYINVKTNL